MYNIVISGYYGFGNAGDEAMLAAILDSLSDRAPGCRITVISGNPERTRAMHGTASIHRFNYFEIVRAIRQCDLLISGGGSLLQDVTSDRSLYYYLSIIGIAVAAGKPVMLYAQGIGPIRKSKARLWAGRLLNQVDYITIRDLHSKEELESMGVTKPEIEVTADAVLSMHPVDRNIGLSILKKYHISEVKPRVGISIRNWENPGEYQQAFALAADQLIENGCEVIFIPMQHKGDVAASRSIAEMMKYSPCILDEEYTTVEAMSLIGCMDAVVGVRLHALIFSALMKVPMVGISYDPKVASFLHMIGEKVHSDIYALTSQGLYEEVQQKLEAGRLRGEVNNRIDWLRDRSAENARIALRIIENSQK